MTSPGSGGLVDWLTRRRVVLGFVCGVVALWLARPTWTSWLAGCLVAAVGEALRIWAAGHLEKNQGVTSSGPYRLTGHPLYVGSTVMAVGFTVAADRVWVAALVVLYVGTTIVPAARRESRYLAKAFSGEHRLYREGTSVSGASRRFSLARAVRNREHRAVLGLLGAAAILAAKIVWTTRWA